MAGITVVSAKVVRSCEISGYILKIRGQNCNILLWKKKERGGLKRFGLRMEAPFSVMGHTSRRASWVAELVE